MRFSSQEGSTFSQEAVAWGSDGLCLEFFPNLKLLTLLSNLVVVTNSMGCGILSLAETDTTLTLSL